MPKTKKTEPDVSRSTDALAFEEFFNEFKAESDRAAVILGAARIDLGLYHLLQHALLPNTSRSDELLEGDSPLSTFSSRINICYRLGLIDAELTRSLHLIRRIRNVFAHEASGSSLDSGSHRDRIRELYTPFLKFKAFTKYREEYFEGFEGASRDFRAVAALIVIRLDTGVSYIEPFKSDNAVNLFPPAFFEEDTENGVEDAVALGAPLEIENERRSE